MKKSIFVALLAIALLVAACSAPTAEPTKAPPASSSSSSVAPSSSASASSSAAPTKAPEPATAKAPASSSAASSSVASSSSAPASASSSAASPASTSAAAEFYKGKTVTVYLGSAAGGYTDVLARIIVNYLPDLTGAKFVVQNDTAGGGRVVLNNMHNTIKNDGLTLLFMPSGSIWPAYMMGDTTVQYDITKFQYVGGISAGNALISVYPKGKIQTADDLMKAKGLKFAATNKTTLPTVSNALGIEILGLDAKIITGFDSSTGRQLALQQGDADATVMSSDTTAKGAKDGIMKPLVQVGTYRMKGYEDIPCLTDLKKLDSLTENQKKMLASIDLLNDAKTFIAPPGTPQDRVDFLTNAIKKAYDTTNMKADITKASGEEAWPFISGAELAKQAANLAAKKGDMGLWIDMLNKYVQ